MGTVSSERQYFEMLHVWKSKFRKKQLPPDFLMEMFYNITCGSVDSLDSYVNGRLVRNIV